VSRPGALPASLPPGESLASSECVDGTRPLRFLFQVESSWSPPSQHEHPADPGIAEYGEAPPLQAPADGGCQFTGLSKGRPCNGATAVRVKEEAKADAVRATTLRQPWSATGQADTVKTVRKGGNCDSDDRSACEADDVGVLVRAGTSGKIVGACITVSQKVLREHFHLPLPTAAKKFGMCTTVFKKLCRRFGIAKWPHRQMRGIDKKIAALKVELNYSTVDKAKFWP